MELVFSLANLIWRAPPTEGPARIYFRLFLAGYLQDDSATTYRATNPPSIAMAWPVTKEAASEQSHTTAAAISSGVPIRPTGCNAVN